MDTPAFLNTPARLAEMLNDCSIDAIIAIDLDWKVIAWNSMAENYSGLQRTQAMDRNILEIMPDLAKDTDSFQAIRRAFKGLKGFVAASDDFLHRQHIENHFIPLKDTSENIIGVMNIMHDVTYRIKAEKQLSQLNLQLQKRYRDLQKTIDELASFTYLSSNNIKEPIKQIYTSVEYLIKNEAKQLSDSGKASFRRIQSALNRMNLLLDDLLSLSQINILYKPDVRVDLDEVLRDVLIKIDQKIKEKQVMVEVGELCTVIGHREQLSLLFYQLLDNAIKFNESHQPHIKITCEKVWLKNVLDPQEYWHLSIKDNGIGFAQEDAEKIFHIFEKLHPKHKYKGSGIGLAIVRKIMDSHDGFITAESDPEKGTVFHCFFPYSDFVH